MHPNGLESSIKRTILAVAASLALTTTAVLASDLVPLEEIMQRPSDEVEVGYPYVRCAGLFTSVIQYGGTNFPDDLRSSFVQAATRFSTVAALIRMSDAENRGEAVVAPEVFAEQAGSEFGAISDLYVARFQRNFASGGQAFDGDTMFKSDMVMCQEMALAVNAYYENQ